MSGSYNISLSIPKAKRLPTLRKKSPFSFSYLRIPNVTARDLCIRVLVYFILNMQNYIIILYIMILKFTFLTCKIQDVK